MQKCEEREFNDDDGTILVKTTQLPAMQAFRLMGRLGKLLSPALSQFKGIKFKADVASLAPVLASLFERLDPEDADSLATSILEGTLAVAGGKAKTLNSIANINDVFSGRLLTMMKVMAFAVEVNFKDFFRGLSSGVAVTPEPGSPST